MKTKLFFGRMIGGFGIYYKKVLINFNDHKNESFVDDFSVGLNQSRHFE